MSPQKQISKYAFVTALALAGAHTAKAHVSYSGRTFSDVLQSITINNVSSGFGWADGTDADFGDSHRTRAFRFTLTEPKVLTISVTGVQVGAAPALQFPGFSLYSGLAHVAPDALDHDASPITAAYLSTLGGVQPKEGAFRALTDWVIGNEDVYNTPGDPLSGVAVPASLKTLTFIGYAVDGTEANFGTGNGVIGDGIADGTVSKTFNLGPGDYSLFVGGADYYNQPDAPYVNYGVTVSIPEPTSTALLGVSVLGLALRRRRIA